MPKAAQFLPDAQSLESEKGVDLIVCQCSRCGLVQLSNEPVPYYKEVIRAAAFSAEMNAFRREQFKDFVARFSLGGKKVLEIGCGKGEYLTLMRETGADAYGVEHGEESVNDCVKAGLKVTRGFVEAGSDALRDAPFDAFFILNFLEHIPDLNSTLRGISSNMSAQAVGLVEVPNFEMILKQKLFSEFINDHLYYFTGETIRSTLNRNGFEVLDCSPVWYDYILSAVVRKRTPLDVSNFAFFQHRLSGELQSYITGFGKKRVVRLGSRTSGPGSFGIGRPCGQDTVRDRLRPLQTGQIHPSTHIPIVPPEALKEDPADAVIVMAASYSDEVAKIIHEKFR
jgi:SAM-dependent methyltransferase